MDKRLTIEINLQNHAFEGNASMEVSRILNTAARKLDDHDFETNNGFYLFDSNGNKCGKLQIHQVDDYEV